MAGFDGLWSVILTTVPSERFDCLSAGVLWIGSLLPMCTPEFLTLISARITASDAPEQGAGVCRTMGLTEESIRQLALTQRQAQEGIPLVHWCLIVRFSGIGVGSHACDPQGLTPGCQVVAEVKESACQGLAGVYLDAIQLGDVTKKTETGMKGPCSPCTKLGYFEWRNDPEQQCFAEQDEPEPNWEFAGVDPADRPLRTCVHCQFSSRQFTTMCQLPCLLLCPVFSQVWASGK